MPQLLQQTNGNDTDEEIDYHFSGMTYCNTVMSQSNEWTIDSGASDHIYDPLSSKFVKPYPS